MCVKYIIPLININGDVKMNTEGCFEGKNRLYQKFSMLKVGGDKI